MRRQSTGHTACLVVGLVLGRASGVSAQGMSAQSVDTRSVDGSSGELGASAFRQPTLLQTQTQTQARRPHRGLLIAGLTVLGCSYLATTIGIGANQLHPQDYFSFQGQYAFYLPVVGPWIVLGVEPAHYIPLPSLNRFLPYVVVSGLVQTTGLALAIAGMLVKGSKTLPQTSATSWHVVPSLFTDRLGVTAVRSF